MSEPVDLSDLHNYKLVFFINSKDECTKNEQAIVEVHFKTLDLIKYQRNFTGPQGSYVITCA